MNVFVKKVAFVTLSLQLKRNSPQILIAVSEDLIRRNVELFLLVNIVNV